MTEHFENRATIDEFWHANNDERLDDCINTYAPEARLRHFSQGIPSSATERDRRWRGLPGWPAEGFDSF